MKKFVTKSEQETIELAADLAKELRGGEFICFYGNLGAGKTAFVKGLARAFGYRGYVTSPTFSIVHEYLGEKNIYHFDMYRMSDTDDLSVTGFYDYQGENNIFAIEWCENIEREIGDKRIDVHIEYGENEDERIITWEKKYDDFSD